MGCDIHPYFERKTKNDWKLVWEPEPDPEYWWESIVEENREDPLKVETIKTLVDDSELDYSFYSYKSEHKSKSKIVKNHLDEDELYYLRFKAYYKNLSMDEVKEKFMCNPKIYLQWNLPLMEERRYKYQSAEVKERNYWWFGILNDVRQGGCLFEKDKGIPDNTSFLVKQQYDRDGSDGHSHSWLMVSEILEKLEKSNNKDCLQYEWLKMFIEDPENTRMVFWFDN